MAKMIYKDTGFLTQPGQMVPRKIKEEELHAPSQVYQATHKGEFRLPFMERSFISFSFGGKIIEDFGIIKVTGGERMQNQLYAGFEDITEEYNVLDGAFYWGTHIKPLELNFVLSTDGMTQRQLDEFNSWFAPGKVRELILAQHPNRAIMVRVSSAPTMSMLPFKGTEFKKIAGTTYQIATTLYKGDIRINFTSEDPYWYALCVLLGTRYKINNDGTIEEDPDGTDTSTGYYEYRWTDVNGNVIGVMSDPDVLKIILQDNIPVPHMIKINDNLFLGNNLMVTRRDSYAGASNNSVSAMVGEQLTDPNPPYAKVGYARLGVSYAPTLHIYNFDQYEGVNLFGDSQYAYLYYQGNAPSHPKLRFTLTPILSTNQNQPPYIIAPKNGYCKVNDSDITYNTIYFTSENTKEFRFSTPSAWTGYNQALYWFKKMAEQSASLEDTKVYIRDYVNHNGARAWGLNIIEYFQGQGKEILVKSGTNSGNKVTVTTIYNYMKTFISKYVNNKWETCSSNFSIDSKTGEAIGELTYREVDKNNQSSGNTGGIPNIFSANSLLKTFTENVGDMVKSNYITLEETNIPNDRGEIVEWSEDNPKATHKIVTDYPSIGKQGNTFIPGLTNFSIQYKCMYR